TVLPPATLSSSCSDNSVGFTSFTSCFASFSIFSIFLLSSLMVFLLFETFSFVNSRGAVEASTRVYIDVLRDRSLRDAPFGGDAAGDAVQFLLRQLGRLHFLHVLL